MLCVGGEFAWVGTGGTDGWMNGWEDGRTGKCDIGMAAYFLLPDYLYTDDGETDEFCRGEIR
jgi:hypothetical protein